MATSPDHNIHEQVERLAKMFDRIRALLNDAEKRDIQDECVKMKLKELKEVAYDAEDILDELHYSILRPQEAHKGSKPAVSAPSEPPVDLRYLCNELVNRSKNGSIDLNDISNKIAEVFDYYHEICTQWNDLSTLQDCPILDQINIGLSHESGFMVDESSIFGRETEKEKVIEHLTSSESRQHVTAIVGMAGIGKTALAQLVYNDKLLRKTFDVKGWIYIDRKLDVPTITRLIIEAITKEKCEISQLSILQERLKRAVKAKNVFMVLDSVWFMQVESWEVLIRPFSRAKRVRIIVTTSNTTFAECVSSESGYGSKSICHLDCLSYNCSWQIFKHFAFGGKDLVVETEQADIGKQIVKKCGGLPLALKSIACLLRCASEDNWKHVLESNLCNLVDDGIISPTLKLSYDYLPAYLKPCFLFCSIFPKHYTFEKEELVRLWMAHNYIRPKPGMRLEDIGHEYFDALQSRSFFELIGETKYKMHSMFYYLAKSISGDECHMATNNSMCDISAAARHLYISGESKLSNL